MHCGACVRRVSQTLATVPGVRVIEVRVGAARLACNEEPAPVDLASVDLAPASLGVINHVVGALAKSGYAAHLES
jgi:copper chaperone